MNKQRLAEIISNYKKDFHSFINDEMYKWEAVKCFQNNWNIESSDFPSMLKLSLSKTKNLLASVNNFPRRMIKNYAEAYPEDIRLLFNNSSFAS